MKLNGITLTGSVSLGSVNLPVENWSGQYFELTDRIFSPLTLSLGFGTGNFTAECFAYLNSNARSAMGLIAMRYGAAGLFNNTFAVINGYSAWSDGSSWSQASSLVPLNQWVHLALVRNSGTITIYQNGISVRTISYPSAITGARPAVLGNLDDPNFSLDGRISNARITNTAVYTSSFTPPTAPLTAIPGTVLLTLQNSTVIDNGPNSFALTNVGVNVVNTGPF